MPRNHIDCEDRQRISAHLQRLLVELRAHRQLTNHQVRGIAGSRGMGRVNDLIRFGYPIDVRKAQGSTWLVTYIGDAEKAQLPLL